MSGLVADPAPGFVRTAAAVEAGLEATSATHTAGPIVKVRGGVQAPVRSQYALPGGMGDWGPRSTVRLVKNSGHWLVEWSPSIIDPSLRSGDRVVLNRVWADRAAILGAGGVALTASAPYVSVGVEGSRIKDPPGLTTVLEAAGASPTEVASALADAAAHPTFFVPVLRLSTARFQQLGGQGSDLYKVAGTVFRDTTARAAVTPGLDAHLVGSVGPITADELRRLGPPYEASSTVGQTGIEAAYEKQLAGSAGGTVDVVHSTGATGATLVSFPPKPGTAVTTSIDPTVQRAAEAALTGVTQNAALVAMRASTGQILASVSNPAASQFDQALNGGFPPGSTFKVITATALIQAGLSPASPTSCPPTLTVDGEPFHNAEGDAPASDVDAAFAESCNTAFIQLAIAHLGSTSLPAAAALYGIGTAPQMGLPAFAGSVPAPRDAAELAATSIGQARVLVSPLNMAVVAASIDSGEVRPARLVAGAADDAVAPQALPEPVVSGLRQMMARVVASGTAAGTGLPAGTYAKTGTAEYGSGQPQPVDAWLMGYRGDVAFAVVVQNAPGNGGPTAGPIIARFLNAIGAST